MGRGDDVLVIVGDAMYEMGDFSQPVSLSLC
jgi:hypothetical protein